MRTFPRFGSRVSSCKVSSLSKWNGAQPGSEICTLLTTVLPRAPIPLTKGAISRPLAAESCLAVKEDRCFISDLTTDVEKREDFLRVTILVEAIARPRQKTQEHNFARVTVMKCGRGVVEDMAVDQAADFHGERGEVWGHFSSAVWTIRGQSSTT